MFDPEKEWNNALANMAAKTEERAKIAQRRINAYTPTEHDEVKKGLRKSEIGSALDRISQSFDQIARQFAKLGTWK